MEKSRELFNFIRKNRLIALLTPNTKNDCLKAYEIFRSMGITLEIAFRSDAAIKGIKAVLNKYPEAMILAGTVMTKTQAEDAIKAGVSGIVSADYIPEVVETCAKNDVICIPGGLSDAGKQLVKKAETYGCTLEKLKQKYPYQWIYKLFPAFIFDRSNIALASSWRGPYKDLTVVYTGGISLSNLKEVVETDPEGIICGSALTKNVNEPEKMKKEAEKWVSIVRGKKFSMEVSEPRKKISKKKPAKVVTIGEIMLRLSPPGKLRFIQTDTFDVNFGGTEANTAVAFANYGLNSVYVTALPENEIGQAAINSLRKFGVDTGFILRQGKRVGIYFLEHGASQRPSKVIYDRAGSSISEIRPEQIDWDIIFKDADWFHWSGITPALSDTTAEVTKKALKTAKKHNVTVSVDLNYRKKLWSREKAKRVMSDLMKYVDIVIGNEEDTECIFGIKAGSSDVSKGQLDIEGYRQVAKTLVKKYKFKKVAITLRESISASDNIWSACMYNGKDFYTSRKYKIHIVDRVGGGDSFSSGFIYSLILGKTDKEALEFGVAASCLKQTIYGDFNIVTTQEVEKIMRGEESGRVQR